MNLKLQKILHFIQTEQSLDGSFLSRTSDSLSVQTTFVTSLILQCLATVSSEAITKNISRKAVEFLLSEKSPHWSWNYWQRKSEQTRLHPCPDDLDDTSCALAAIALHSPDSLDAVALASATKLLILAEEKPGGPYNTWLVGDRKNPQWTDYDIVVNSNIAYFLKLQDIRLPNLVEQAELAISKGIYQSLYYSPLHVMYFIARWYEGSLIKKLEEDILKLQRNDGDWGSLLENAIAVSSLIRIGANKKYYEGAVHKMISASGGPWQALPFYIESIKKDSLYAKSSALTAALCLEALGLSIAEKTQTQLSCGTKRGIHERIKLKVLANISLLPEKSMLYAEKIIDTMTSTKSGRHITLLPFEFAENLTFFMNIRKDFLETLGVANLHGWLSYKIYDDIMDNDRIPGLLPVANMCARKVYEIYYDAFEKQDEYIDIMNSMEAANALEHTISYFPNEEFMYDDTSLPDYKNYSILAEKSLPHCLGPLAILACKESGLTKSAVQNDSAATIEFFKNYIIARQLNDDAHDWLKDLKKGFVNPASTKILKRMKRCGQKIIDCEHELNSIFWNSVILEIAEEIFFHIEKARLQAYAITSLKDTSYLLSILEPIRSATEKALSERKRTLEFLKSYGSKTRC